MPEGETCLSQIPYSFYAPAAMMFTDQLSEEIRTIIRRLDASDPCRGYITYVMCAHRFPACNATTGLLLPLCPTVCPNLINIVETCSSEYFIGDPNFPAMNQLFSTFICTDPESYYTFPRLNQYVDTDPSNCIRFSKYVYCK